MVLIQVGLLWLAWSLDSVNISVPGMLMLVIAISTFAGMGFDWFDTTQRSMIMSSAAGLGIVLGLSVRQPALVVIATSLCAIASFSTAQKAQREKMHDSLPVLYLLSLPWVGIVFDFLHFIMSKFADMIAHDNPNPKR